MLHDRFEWDRNKAAANLAKHGVSFDDAACVLADKSAGFYQCEKYDADHSRKEDRFLTVASHPEDRSIVLVVSWTERNRGTALVTRIVSARHATCGERKIYAECVNGKIGL